jgi:hypothetical protein
MFTCFIVASTSGCMQSSAAKTSESEPAKNDLSENALKMVNAAFYQKLVGGEWRYKGAKNQGGSINAYIQMPNELDMTNKVKKQYLQTVICPSAQHASMWQEIESTPLYVHVYIHKQKHSAYANCKNPLLG